MEVKSMAFNVSMFEETEKVITTEEVVIMFPLNRKYINSDMTEMEYAEYKCKGPLSYLEFIAECKKGYHKFLQSRPDDMSENHSFLEFARLKDGKWYLSFGS